jgi:hypothetical protein
MAKRIARKSKTTAEYKSWNFILFLTLAFILLVILLGAITSVSNDLQAKAGLRCATPKLPDASACPGGWKYTQTENGCATFVCEAN